MMSVMRYSDGSHHVWLLGGALLAVACSGDGTEQPSAGSGGVLADAAAGGALPDAGPDAGGAPADAAPDAPDADADVAFSFAVFADVHIGEGHDAYDGGEDDVTANARLAVARVNALAASEGIAFAFILGDLTQSGEPLELIKARQILDDLVVPWYPCLGNHDVWPYTSSSEEPLPDGDAHFAATFGDRFAGLEYPDLTVWDPELGFDVRFQSFELRREHIVLISPDWNTRWHAVPGYPGALGGGDLHDFPGGTLPWLRDRLAALPAGTKRVIFLQHQGFATQPPIPEWTFTFSGEEQAIFRNTLSSYAPIELYWGVLAGHSHRRWEGPAFVEWPFFAQVETAACKDSADVTLVRVAADGTVEIVLDP